MNDTIDQLDRILTQERSLILDGSYDELAALADRKEQLLAQMPGESRGALRRLRDKALSNEHLLSAARTGMRVVQRRLNEMQNIASLGMGYDAQGRSKTAGTQVRYDQKS